MQRGNGRGTCSRRVRVLVAAASVIAHHLDCVCPRRSILLECYKTLRGDELAMLPQRLSTLTAEAADVTQREADLQAQYAQLAAEVEDARAGRVHTKPAPSADMDLND